MSAWFQRLYAPAFFFGFILAALYAVDGLGLRPHWALPPLLALSLAVSFASERALPYRREWNRGPGERGRDAIHFVVNEGLNLAGLALLPLAAAWRPWPVLWPQSWPLALQLAAAIVLADLGLTLAHYASHRWPLLWRFHAVHHSVTRMYGFNGLMKHPLHQAVEAAAGVGPLIALGLPLEATCVLAFAIAIQLQLQHSNVDMRIGPLRHVFAWAPVHRLHHLRYGRAGDVNFALFFSVWDRLLGTAAQAPGYRVGSEDLGIGSHPDYPRDYAGQLLEPFRTRPAQAEPALPPALRAALAQD
ncbi:sterol desaturase family protein [Lysobacter enzymogenes]|uniref:sterol desaturase family protein n=1 Tax=Lysobacter enzymogenes TaxID=69 RepID=UPI0008949D04|nr:sterol desaturase family protein [Lysobacter enzymogenes]SDX42720.1 Sterol desaturase/sphingolipid hydroxylase, fatty acid hydroxylase superfamily [Lysobacter enzymogenes]